jgi:putative endonuclease
MAGVPTDTQHGSGALREPAGPLTARATARAHRAARLGRAAEDVAARFLVSQGLELVLRNFRRRLGEIDLVACDADVIVIAEVRTRSNHAYGGAAASVGARKRARIVRAAQLFLQRHPQFMRRRLRFDVVIVFDALARVPRVQWIKHAFSST